MISDNNRGIVIGRTLRCREIWSSMLTPIPSRALNLDLQGRLAPVSSLGVVSGSC